MKSRFFMPSSEKASNKSLATNTNIKSKTLNPYLQLASCVTQNLNNLEFLPNQTFRTCEPELKEYLDSFHSAPKPGS